jgi:hypothetical protein
MADVTTIAELGTAVGTLFLGAATFGATRSANRAARVAERSLLLGLRPVLTPSRPEDPDLEILYGDGKSFHVPSGGALVEVVDDVVYLAIPLRNVGAGLAVLQRYDVTPENPLHEIHRQREHGIHARRERRHGPLENFREQQRDIYIASADTGFWQAALRDREDELRVRVIETLAGTPTPISVDLLYGDHEDGQHSISRFNLIPNDDGSWLAAVAFHWVLEGADPRESG